MSACQGDRSRITSYNVCYTKLLRTYRVRGDIIDIFPGDEESQAIRVELFDDEVESICVLDPLTGEMLRKLERITIYPKSHYVTPRQVVLDAAGSIADELEP